MKKIDKKLFKMIDEMIKNSCEKIGFPYDELCFETVLTDLQHTFEIVITNETNITHELLTTIAECVRKWEIETERNFVNSDGTISI